MFKSWLSIFGSPTIPHRGIYRNERIRRKEEEIAYNINSKLGEVVEKKNNVERSIENCMESNSYPLLKRLIDKSDNFMVGDHVYIQCIGFTHHGLYIGSGMVIHYSGGLIRYDTIEDFSEGKNIYVRSEIDSPMKYSRSIVVSRAESRLNETEYNLVFNNCEHFVLWCRSGS